MKHKVYEIISRYLFGLFYLFGAIDGILNVFFGIYLSGESTSSEFLAVLRQTTYFWVLLKVVMLCGALSVLLNYKPSFGVALLTPITAVLALFYLFEAHWYHMCAAITILNVILLKAYWNNYRPMFESQV